MGSALGKALSMTSSTSWNDIVNKLKGIAAKTSGNQSISTSGKWGFDTKYGPWVYIPANAYYTTSHWLNIPWDTIKGSFGTASAGNVLTGHSFTSQNGIKLSGSMKNYSSAIQTATTSATDQTKSCYRLNGSYIEVVPAIGYWGTWNWDASCIKVPRSVISGTYAFHHTMRLYQNNSTASAITMNPSATTSGSAKWTNHGYSYNSGLFSYSNGVYTAKISCTIAVDGVTHSLYGRSLQIIQYSINNGTKYDICRSAASEDTDVNSYSGNWKSIKINAGQNIRFFFYDGETHNTDTGFYIFGRIA